MASHEIAPRPLPRGMTLSHEPPGLEEYVAMRRIAGLTPRTPAQSAPALTGSWGWTTVRADDGTLAAMGRVLGDGGWYFHIADMATHPDHQRRGIGRAVLEDLIARIEASCPPDPYITLMADPPGRRLYDAVGFVESAPTIGMRLDRRGPRAAT